jgi:histidinol-phosphate aminotransferase
VPGSSLPLRQDLTGLTPYGAPQLDVPVQLNVNENPYPPPAPVVDAITQAVSKAARRANRYPDREFLELRHAIAEYLNDEAGLTGDRRITAEQVWAGNGSNEVMLHLFQAFGGPGRSAVTFSPSYSMYSEYALVTHTGFASVPRLPDFTIDLGAAEQLIRSKRPALILIASPNNPTGTALSRCELQAILEFARSVQVDGTCANPLVVVDEAYAEFRRAGTPSALELLPDYPNLIVTRTMSKAFGAAGLRLGYLAAAPGLIDALRLVRLPYHLSSVTQAAAVAALEQQVLLRAQVNEIRQERDSLANWLRGLSDASGSQVQVADSDANFIMFGRFADPGKVWQGLLDQDILIREVGPTGWLRVSIGTPAENQAFMSALSGMIAESKLIV